ncbi:MAG TPA: ABC transporter ATP-binding protein [bacterium]|nr:ABC transporter ATP-binding protein [bacterium]
MSFAIKLKDVKKTFHVGIQDIEVLKGITFNVEEGDFVIIIGPSGCGKSTLLHTLLGLEGPTSGYVEVLGEDIYGEDRDEDSRSLFRKKHIGMIYQQANWIKALTVVENVAFPLSLLGVRKDQSLVKAWEALTQIGMKNWSNHAPTELSSGQQQKVALARALITDAQIIVADEPTGNLDYNSGQELMSMLVDLNSKGKTVIMVTHDLEYLKYSKTAVQMLDGKVEGIYRGQEKAALESSVKLKRGTDEDGKRDATVDKKKEEIVGKEAVGSKIESVK